MNEGGISQEVNSGLKTKETICATVVRKAQRVVDDVRGNPATKKVTLGVTTGLIFFSTACGLGRPPEVSSATFVPPTPTVDVAPSVIDQGAQTHEGQLPDQDEDIQTRFMKEAEKQRRQQLESLRINETPQEIHGNTIIFDHDFDNEKPRLQMIVPRIDQETHLKGILKDDYISPEQLELEFGKDFRENVDLIWKKYPKVALAYYWLNEYGNHGEYVEDSRNRVLNIFGFNSQKTDFYPLQNLQGQDRSDYTLPEIVYDNLGNAGIFPDNQPEPLIDAIKSVKANSPQKTRFNFSFTMGKGGFWVITKEMRTQLEKVPKFNSIFDRQSDEWIYFPETAIPTVTNEGIKIVSVTGEPIKPLTEKETEEAREKAAREFQEEVTYDSPQFKKVEGYNPKYSSESLSKMFKVVDSFPDNVFFAAAGNIEDDLRGMKSEQPKNLLFVAQWNSFKEGPDGKVDGADIYFDNQFFGLGGGSSASTPAISALADILEFYGLDNSQIIETSKSSCDFVSYERDGETFNANLFSPQKFKAATELLKTSKRIGMK